MNGLLERSDEVYAKHNIVDWVTILRKVGKTLASGNEVLQIHFYQNKGLDPVFLSSDALFLFEECAKLQPCSPIIRGILGHTVDKDYLVVKAAAVSEATCGNMDPFTIHNDVLTRYSEVRYHCSKSKFLEHCMLSEHAEYDDVVLLHLDYNKRVHLTPEQFQAICAPEVEIATLNSPLELQEIVQGSEVLHKGLRPYESSIVERVNKSPWPITCGWNGVEPSRGYAKMCAVTIHPKNYSLDLFSEPHFSVSMECIVKIPELAVRDLRR